MATPRDCTGVLTPLAGQAVIVTGAALVAGTQTRLDGCLRLAEQVEERPLTKFSGNVILLVQGPTSEDNVTIRSPTDLVSSSTPQAIVAAGRHIQLVNSTRFTDLLHR